MRSDTWTGALLFEDNVSACAFTTQMKFPHKYKYDSFLTIWLHGEEFCRVLSVQGVRGTYVLV